MKRNCFVSCATTGPSSERSLTCPTTTDRQKMQSSISEAWLGAPQDDGEELGLRARLVRDESWQLSTFYNTNLSVTLFQKLFGTKGTAKDKFKMFESQTKDLLFKDLTKCLVKLRDGITYKEFLGDQYYASVASLNTCNPSGNWNSPGKKPVNDSSWPHRMST